MSLLRTLRPSIGHVALFSKWSSQLCDFLYLSLSLPLFVFFHSLSLVLSYSLFQSMFLSAFLPACMFDCLLVNLSIYLTDFFTIPSPTSLLLKSPHTYIPSSVMLLSLYFLNTYIPFFFPLFIYLFPPPSLSILSSHLFPPYLLSLSSSYLKFLSIPLISSALISFPLFFNLPDSTHLSKFIGALLPHTGCDINILSGAGIWAWGAPWLCGRPVSAPASYT